MDKTVVVAVEDRFTHALYGKVVRRTSKLQGARREQTRAGVGDRVLVMETRPLSRHQAVARWARSSRRRSDDLQGQVCTAHQFGNDLESIEEGSVRLASREPT
jgi:ribosomal protein S17